MATPRTQELPLSWAFFAQLAPSKLCRLCEKCQVLVCIVTSTKYIQTNAITFIASASSKPARWAGRMNVRRLNVVRHDVLLPERRLRIGRLNKNFNKDLLLSLSEVRRATSVQAQLLTKLQNSFMLAPQTARRNHTRCRTGTP